ncbi:MAG: DUF7666 domain-containing protein [Rhodoferax sp.]
MTAKAKKKVKAIEESITSFKGFNDKWECRGFKYKVGETFKHDGAVKACDSGFHACEYPLDVFRYYPPAGNRFAVVQQSGDLSRHDGDTKVASKSISIMAEISIAGLVKAAIEYTSSRCNPIDPDSPASSTGYQGAASSTGARGAASSTGARGAASSTGDYGAASSTGDYGAASSTGKHSVAIACGREGRAMAGETGAIVLVHRDSDGNITHIRASKVGDNGIRPGVWYELDINGQFVEAEDEGVTA